MNDKSASLNAAKMIQWTAQRRSALLNRKSNLFSSHLASRAQLWGGADNVDLANELISSIISDEASCEISQNWDDVFHSKELVNGHNVDEIQKTTYKSTSFLEELSRQDSSLLESVGEGYIVGKTASNSANQQLSVLIMSDCNIVQDYVQNISAIDQSVSFANLSKPVATDFENQAGQLSDGIIEKSKCIPYLDSSLPFI